jgi:CheY-like chemotaxis protein
VRDDIHQIGEAAERAASLTRQLLAFSRRQILKPRRVNLASLVGGLLPMLNRLIGEDVELRFQAGAAAAQAEADPGQLEQVVMNLVVNARDAIPVGGGRIMVETREVQVREGDEGPDAGLAPGCYAVLAVRDSGTGMPDEVRRRVFEPFFTTKEPGKGTGLGLSTVYGIVKQSDGHVFVDSAPGSGTEFRVYLPAQAAPEPTADEARPLPATGTETVLLIEDEEAVRSLTRRVLTRHGYTVLEACDGSEALEMARLQAHRIDLVISDVVMPGRSGPSAAGEISEIAGGAPVLYMSGYTDDDILRRGVRTADTHFLQKPFSPHAILAQVRALLDARPR